MLLSLRIENFALIDRLELEFAAGLNVLTGETGAGKSIILDAVEVLLGGKVSGRLIRTGSERALLEASFALTPLLKDWLAAEQIDLLEDDQVICSREINQSQGGLRSRSRLNGVLVNRQQLDSLRDRLVSITAQGQAIQLGQAARQREWLDEFGGNALLTQKVRVAADFRQFQQASQALERHRQTERQRFQQLDGLQYQLRELQQAQLSDPNEQTLTEQEYQRLSHSGELQQQSYLVYQALYEQEQGAAGSDLLGKAVTTLAEMSEYDPELQPILELVQDALTQVQEAGRQINIYAGSLETDPQRLQEVAERLMQLKQISRKYGPTLPEAIAYQQRIEQELAELTNPEQAIAALEQAFQQAEVQLQGSCQQLTQLRQATAEDLTRRLLQALTPLGMDKVKFKVGLDPIAPTAHGADQVEFLFSPNPGEPLQPLSETASGGEMSRFLLALQACFSQVDPVGSLMFDEIDVGVSGRVSQAIAETLHTLSQNHQVLCVTHQPVVAAMGDRHFRVEKQVLETELSASSQARDQLDLELSSSVSERTVVRVVVLDHQQRRQELAQLSGGRSLEQAIAFAESLLSQAATFRQPPAKPGKRSRQKASP
jgi:DNA repair protein RecN (Recombination protein N)